MISNTAEYALRAVVYLASQNGTPRSRAEIAEHALLPMDYLARIMQALAAAGIVSVRRGPGGGYTMVASKESLTVLDVVSAVDPVSRVARCPLGLPTHIQLCPLHSKLAEASQLVETAFRETLVTELIPSDTAQDTNETCSFPI